MAALLGGDRIAAAKSGETQSPHAHTSSTQKVNFILISRIYSLVSFAEKDFLSLSLSLLNALRRSFFQCGTPHIFVIILHTVFVYRLHSAYA